jgi:TPR repeat protein/transglutaminase-like putative cysteine protease
MIKRIYSALFLLLISPTFVVANAADATSGYRGPVWVDPGWRRTISRYVVTFDEQGLSTTVFDFEILALDEKGARAISQETFPYNSYFSELTSSDLATLKADGRVIAVDERATRDQPASADTSSPYFDEQRQRIVAYPNVSPGDRIRGRLIYQAKKPMFAGEYARYWSQPADQPPEMIELTIDGPASRPLHVSAYDVEHSEERLGERIVHHVRLRQETPKPRQLDGDRFDDARRFEVSTFADYAAFAAVLNARNAPMAVPDETVRKLSTEIVGDAGDISAKVERIHNWVTRNIRYVGIGFEDGGWTSQPASAVLASRYGDCKAHATVIKALLAAQGIEANLVAVNAGEPYALTAVATPNFDHAIVYVPQVDQYLDPTASFLAFGSLPPNLNGKPVLNIDKGTVGSIPVAKPERFAMAADTDYTLASDGTRQARSILSGTGLGAAVGRSFAQALEGVDRPGVAKKLIEQARLTGTGDYSFPDPHEPSDSYAITATFQISQPVDLNEPVRIRMLPLTDSRPPLLVLSTGGVNDRPFPCRSLEYRETASLTIPAASNFREKPAPITYAANIQGSTAYGTVRGRIEVNGSAVIDGRTIRSNALVRLTFDAAVCPAQFAAAIKAGLDKFTEFKYGPIGLTPKSSPYVTNISPDLDDGVNAFKAGSYKLAMERLKPLAERGDARAQLYLASIYDGGRGIARDFREAFRWYLLAAEQGDDYSQMHVGYSYEAGLGVARDEKVAAQWYAKAADQGEAYSQARLASMYRDGRGGLAQDFQQAANWFAKAADQGSTWAQLNLGLLYIKGQGVPLDYTKAMFWLRNAADRNDSLAQYNLGWAYESGEGVPKDKEEAIKWYGRAADGGNQEAHARLVGLTAGDSFWTGPFRRLSRLRNQISAAVLVIGDTIAQIADWRWRTV